MNRETKPRIYLSMLVSLAIFASEGLADNKYPWISSYKSSSAIANRIALPACYERVSVAPGSFQEWLRYLPLKPAGSPVFLYNGQKKSKQNIHAAVIDIDIGKRDLQQCADAIIRLRAEYLFNHRRYEAIHFNFTDGSTALYVKWQLGDRPRLTGGRVTWQKVGGNDFSYRGFKAYLQTVFTYTGSFSLSKELIRVEDIFQMQIGDVFIQGGHPGHAVMVVDMARHRATGRVIFLLAQSYMPAQDIHLLLNPQKDLASPWYDMDFGQTLVTPEWNFNKNSLKRFVDFKGRQ